MSERTVRVGVIGTGMIGSLHARNLAHRTPGAKVVAVADVDLVRAEAVVAECGGARVHTNASALIADEQVQAVLIASPDATHAECTIGCIEAGKPVLCEKPLATNPAQAERVFRAELATGRRLVQVGFMREYDPAHRDLAALLARGEIGRALVFRGVHNNPSEGTERGLEEVIVNSAIHDIHSARWMMGQEIEGVYVRWVPAHPERPGTCRFLVVQMTFCDGALGTIECNADSGYGYEVSVEITGEEGAARTASPRSPTLRRSGALSQAVDVHWSTRFGAAYLNEVQAWTRSILDRAPGGPSAWDGYTSLVVAHACIRSARTGRPQAVPIIGRPALY